MGWSDFLGDIDWAGIVSRAIPAAIGTYMTTSANEDAASAIAGANTQAAQIAANANLQASREIIEANAEAARLAREGSERAQARYEPIIAGTRPALDYLGRVVADRSITPEQQQRIMDVRRETANQLASRLGGRSATAIATRAAGNLENQIYGANQARSDEAAARLTGVNTAATTASAGTDANLGQMLANAASTTGQNVARLTSGTGANTGNLTASTGQTMADASLSNARATQGAIGEVLSPSLLDVLRSYDANDNKGNYSGGVSEKW